MSNYNTNHKIQTRPFLLNEQYIVKTKKIPGPSVCKLKLKSGTPRRKQGKKKLIRICPPKKRGKLRRRRVMIIRKKIIRYISQATPEARGLPGLQGPPGQDGLQGFLGLQGTPGLQGLQGYWGPQGHKGAEGSQGLQGLPGAEGPAGPQGLQGIPGAEGPAGPQGLQGLSGAEGPAGPQGLQGLTGAEGPVGPQGPQGPLGQISSLLTATRYSYIASSDMEPPVDIPANQFKDDNGDPVTAFAVIDSMSYSDLFINGILQLGGTYTLNSSTLTLLNGQDSIFEGTPIVLEIIQLVIQIIPPSI